ncbi:unnamed protein product, partial [Chrysoparadoxa australica]
MRRLFRLLLSTLPWMHCSAIIHKLTITRDTRPLYLIETFGFSEGGVADLRVEGFVLHPRKNHITPPTATAKDEEEGFRMGLVLRKVPSYSSAEEDIEEVLEANAKAEEAQARQCMLDKVQEGDAVLDLSEPSRWEKAQLTKEVLPGEEGLYSLVFCRCQPASESRHVSYHLRAEMVNPGPNHLSAGESLLPSVFLVFGLLFSMLLVAWVVGLKKAQENQVHSIHHLMTMLLVFKTLSLLAESVRLHYVKQTGFSEAWSIVYFTFAFLKGVTLFVVILLIGTGWSLLKPYLSQREKRLMALVLSLQVLANVAMVVFENTAPGSLLSVKWRDACGVLDILACLGILLPIIWSVRHLREATQNSGRNLDAITKLNQFKQFYILVFTYIYATRIIAFLLGQSLPFQLLWLQSVFSEAATMAFYVTTGLKFRPALSSAYLPLGKVEEEEEEAA